MMKMKMMVGAAVLALLAAGAWLVFRGPDEAVFGGGAELAGSGISADGRDAGAGVPGVGKDDGVAFQKLEAGASAQTADGQADQRSALQEAAAGAPKTAAGPREARGARAPLPVATGMSPLPVEAVMAVPGRKISARVEVAQKAFDLVADQVGTLELAERVPLNGEVRVSVAYPELEPGAKIAAAVEDGGQLEDGQRVIRLVLDERRQASFKFKTGDGPGIHRVSLRSGGDFKVVQLWAGR